MARGWHYTRLSLWSALVLSFFWHVLCVTVLFFLSFCLFVLFLFSCSRWSIVDDDDDVPLTFSCPADHVQYSMKILDWQPIT